ncbi:hypothetical protein [Fluviicola sp.]|uniref:hypothetical protein n=1 Tax=Fluviicola sp. TaxID=1917219 RepID=UPI0031D3CB17
MKKSLLLLLLVIAGTTPYFSQTNSLPTTGNVGIGTTAPDQKLTVRGSARIDSMLVVKDSIVVNKTATIKSDLKVVGNANLKNDLRVGGSTTLIGTTIIKEGDLKIRSLGDSTLPGDGVLLVNANGKLKNGGELKSLVYSESTYVPCKDDNEGNTTPASPVWLNGPGKLYTSRHCVPDILVGIDQNNPESKLHISINADKDTHPIIVDKKMTGTTERYKLMQLDNTGLLYAREIKVNLNQLWPDYVFAENYELMPLEELKEYIAENNHLPNVPSASEMEEEGVNVAKSNVMLMEKVEELTLYLLQMKEQLEEQKRLLQQQRELILQLQEQTKP